MTAVRTLVFGHQPLLVSTLQVMQLHVSSILIVGLFKTLVLKGKICRQSGIVQRINTLQLVIEAGSLIQTGY